MSRTYVVKLTTIRIAYIAVLAALSVVCNVFSIPIGPNRYISFAYIPCFVAGLFMGPVAGLLVGLVGDVLGVLIFQTGPWIPLITLSSALLGLIPGLISKIPRLNPYLKIAVAFVIVFFVCTAGFNTLGLWLTYAAGKKTFWVYLAGRLPLQALVLGINAVLMYALYPVAKRFLFARFA